MSTEWTEIISILRREQLLDACQLNPGATAEQLKELEEHIQQPLPPTLSSFLSEHNGQDSTATLGLYLGREVLSTEGIRRQWDAWRSIDEALMNEDCADFMSSEPPGAIKPMYTNHRWIPLTHDYGGNHIGLDFDPDTGGVAGQMIIFGRDEDQKRLLANSFQEFLPLMVAELREADWSFANDLREK